MTTWQEFAAAAPRVSSIFARRHQQADRLCLLGTLRSDGYPRISPVEPCIFEGQLVIAGMPGTTKFLDLNRDPRFTLHNSIDDHDRAIASSVEGDDHGLKITIWKAGEPEQVTSPGQSGQGSPARLLP
ncbi:pyridoxamine 5'-phosphate oxidase family protein [Microlunatus sp. GCM10028923]|uniref:pyridoxamine 5'-phosphate oxidase family protein n=1 Tax=Microlunatus sp. GCM10028923 TaxID=3273400 RepID=UPI003614E7B5